MSQLILKCNKCGEQITATDFQDGDTIVCPSCHNAQIISSMGHDIPIGASRSQIRKLLWAFSWLIYSTAILYVPAETPFIIYNKQLTWLIAIVWISVPLGAYYAVREKQESREVYQEHLARKKDFDREMLGRKKR